MHKYEITLKQQRTGLIVKTFTELSKTKKFLRAKWRARTMFEKPKLTVVINRLVNYPGEQQTLFND